MTSEHWGATSLMLSNTSFDSTGLGTQVFSPAGLLCHVYLYQPGVVYGGWSVHSRSANFIKLFFMFEHAHYLDSPPAKVCEWFGLDYGWVNQLEAEWAELHCNYPLERAKVTLVEALVRPELKRLGHE